MIASVYLFLLGIPGWLAFRALKVPAAPILGAMTLVGALRILGYSPPPTPEIMKPLLQIVCGMFIGLRVTTEIKRAFRRMMSLAIVVSVYWMVTALATGYLLYTVTSLDLATALLGSTPGGVSEMGLMAFSLGADPATVALMQFFRLVLVLVLVPLLHPLLGRLLATKPHTAAAAGAAALAAAGAPENPARTSPATAASVPVSSAVAGAVSGNGELAAAEASPGAPQESRLAGGRGGWSTRGRLPKLTVRAAHLRTLLLAAAGGLALNAVGFPAGGLVGAMIAVGIGRVLEWDCAGFPGDVRSIAQVGLGAIIGLSFSSEMVSSIARMALPVALLSVALFTNGCLLAVIIHRLTGWDIRTCLVATSAGGVTQMSIVADDMGADPVTVTLLHVVRIITIVAVLPPVLTFLLR
ncbi:MAG: AbrB family transcriptional regulator [Bacillota bacterium]|nr:AbrB family transcriptional regulator [Bacillota bacterium]